VKLPKELQLAKLVSEAPEGDGWLHEQKFDGYRIVAVKDGSDVQLLSRRFKDWTAEFPAVAAAVGKLNPQPLSLEQRKHALAELIGTKAEGVLRYSDHVIGRGREFFQLACKRGLEGIVSKRRDSLYSGGRGGAWLKTKCTLRQELVIGGYTDPEGARTHVGALLVGYYEGKELRYAGKVGTGFTQKLLAELTRLFAPLARDSCPFTPTPRGARMHWLEPKLVCEVAFAEWTNDGCLRHPSFQGLRGDKLARDVIRERPT
jgi:bifunctional non-homologous end joining protein LigD